MIFVGKRKFKISRLKGKKKIPSSSSSSLTPPIPPWIELPADVTANILHRVGSVEILESAQKVCTAWHSVCKDPAMWRVIDMRNSGDLDLPYDLEVMCLHAVNRSQGLLIEINVEYFGTDELLFHISDSCSRLKCLTLVHCCDISREGLKEAVKKFPELEELNLSFMHAYPEDVEVIGTSCPHLKSFTFKALGSSPVVGKDLYSLAVAKSMPNLRHLCLLGDKMTNEGLEALLDGCPHLESLDIGDALVSI